MNTEAIQISGGKTAGGLTNLSDEDLIKHVISKAGNDATSEEIEQAVRELIVSAQG